MKIYKTDLHGCIKENEKIEEGTWINMINPKKEEIDEVAEKCNIPIEFLENPLDLEETARIQYDKETECTLIINDFPIKQGSEEKNDSYITIPVGIILAEGQIVTICSADNNLSEKLIKENSNTTKKTTFALDVLYYISEEYINKLKLINKERLRIEKKLRDSLTNKELYDLMEVEKSLVYFVTSLKANNGILSKMNRLKVITLSEEENDLLEEIKIENLQAMETTELYTRIMDSVTNSYSSLISNKLNNTMKTLTLLTVFLTLPMIVFSFFGMNVTLPIKENHNLSWILTIIVSVVLMFGMMFILWRKKIFK